MRAARWTWTWQSSRSACARARCSARRIFFFGGLNRFPSALRHRVPIYPMSLHSCGRRRPDKDADERLAVPAEFGDDGRARVTEKSVFLLVSRRPPNTKSEGHISTLPGVSGG